MNSSLSLHTAARRYCIDQHAYWCSVYQKAGEGRVGSGYSDKALDTFPRYNVLNAILTEVERIDADNLPDFEKLQKDLITAGGKAQSIFTQPPHGNIESVAMEDERKKFCAYIKNLTETLVVNIEQLSYRLVLPKTTLNLLREQVKKEWGAFKEHYWYPLTEQTDPSLFAFSTSEFDKEFPPERLQSIVRSWGNERLFELREDGDENYCLSVDVWEPYYNGAEGYWFSKNQDWILYASHESSITTGGRLTKEIFELWPTAEKYKWEYPV